jgi:hypothetical protein
MSIFFAEYNDYKSSINIIKYQKKEAHKCCEKKWRTTPKHYFRDSFFFMKLVVNFFQCNYLCLSLFCHKNPSKLSDMGISNGRALLDYRQYLASWNDIIILPMAFWNRRL